jgi:transposase
LSQAGGQRRRRRLHSDEFKADAVAACTQPGVSMAAVALSLGVNANLLRRWVREAELSAASKPALIEARPESAPPMPAPFVPLQLPAPVVKDIRVELRRGPTTVSVTWPAEAAGECALWIRELLR